MTYCKRIQVVATETHRIVYDNVRKKKKPRREIASFEIKKRSFPKFSH